MTTAIEGAELTQVGPGTAMGQLMRHYWLPALKSSELERDGPPTPCTKPLTWLSPRQADEIPLPWCADLMIGTLTGLHRHLCL